jgi:hypothetical protein
MIAGRAISRTCHERADYRKLMSGNELRRFKTVRFQKKHCTTLQVIARGGPLVPRRAALSRLGVAAGSTEASLPRAISKRYIL